MKFLDLKTDYAFKKVFGSADATNRLKSMLNAVLEYPPEHQIIDLTIVDPYQIPRLKGMKDSYVDVKAQLSDGQHIIIEMQVLNVKGFEQRILYNAAKHYAQQLDKGEDYTLLNPVIGLSFLDFQLFETPQAINRFKLLEKDTLMEYSDDIELIFVELPKLHISTPSNLKEQWLYLIKHAGELEQIPTYLNEPYIVEALDTANEIHLSKEELELQEKRHDFIRLQKGAWALAEERGMEKGIEKGMEKGREEGLEQGIKQGIEQEKLAIARNCLNQGMGVDDIGAITGLSVAQLQALQTQHETR